MRILITQPYVPAYRVPLFRELSRILGRSDHTLVVASGLPEASQAKRQDRAAREAWSADIRSFDVPVGGHRIKLRRMPKGMNRPDLIVSELEALNTFAWASTLRRDVPIVLWGHGKPYVNSSSWLADQLEWSLVRRASHIVTYTEGGRQFLLDKAGIDPTSVTAIGNSTDTQAIRRSMSSLTESDRRAARKEVGEGTRALFVGGLDTSKRIDFLLDAADAAVRIDPGFRLVIVGSGELDALVEKRVAAGAPLVLFKEARGERLASLASAADAVWMPGRVGLVAVDSVALGLPLHTTNYEFHAPEIELLQSDEVEYLTNSPAAFASDSLNLMSTRGPGERRLRADIPSIEKTAEAFAAVILSQLPS